MHEALWTRVEAELDARRSPFEDSALAAALAADPEGAAAVRRLLAGLARLPERAPRRPSRRLRTLVAAAALLGLASLAWRARDSAGAAQGEAKLTYETKLSVLVQRTTPSLPRVARVELGPRRVLEWTLEGERP